MVRAFFYLSTTYSRRVIIMNNKYRELLEQTERIEKLLEGLLKSLNDYLEKGGVPVKTDKDK